ncbi:hypothetical protein NDU88_000593 [Pleurodeles waltl]|uniref:Uncharacterized protein n=1 Tax=Pleurodeles waltl TaxID=8319 RepID=A0AAV7VTZ6_PLEWA|nr:hypothetical protein NDU88_000593 [Pleurodeles waltl]
MFRSPPQDCRYADEQWQPTELDILKTQEKRKQTNDRHPGWKFRTLFEPDIWIVQKIAGTIVAARKVGNQVTRKVSWFWRVEPRDGDSGADPLEESGEELEGGHVSQPSSPDECRPGCDEVPAEISKGPVPRIGDPHEG